MDKSVTFIHAADLHLGAPFKGLRSLSSVWADKLVQAIPESYNRIIEEAINSHVDFVVFSGDIFDNTHPSYADFSLFVEGMNKLKEENIAVYFCMGNHDPYTSWKDDLGELPENAYAFSPNEPDFTVFKKDGEPLVILGGRSYYTQAWALDDDISEGLTRNQAFLQMGIEAPFVVGVIHTGLNIDPTRSPVDPKKLLLGNFDYWACGHIHQAMTFPEEHPSIVFSGCPQGRAINERGEHGVFKVTLKENTPPFLEFIPTASVVWDQLKIDISHCSTISEIQEQIVNEQFARNGVNRCQNMIFRVTLIGASNLHKELTSSVIEDLKNLLNGTYPFFFIDSIVNYTKPVLNQSFLRKEGLFPSVLFDVLDKQKSNPKETMLYLEKQFYGKDLLFPNNLERSLKDLYEQSEITLFDLLGNGE